jgi:hypothetical protein
VRQRAGERTCDADGHAAVKAITAAQLSMAADGVYSVTLDEGACAGWPAWADADPRACFTAIAAMKLTARDMNHKYKETSLSVRVLSCWGCAALMCSMRRAWRRPSRSRSRSRRADAYALGHGETQRS